MDPREQLLQAAHKCAENSNRAAESGWQQEHAAVASHWASAAKTLCEAAELAARA